MTPDGKGFWSCANDRSANVFRMSLHYQLIRLASSMCTLSTRPSQSDHCRDTHLSFTQSQLSLMVPVPSVQAKMAHSEYGHVRLINSFLEAAHVSLTVHRNGACADHPTLIQLNLVGGCCSRSERTDFVHRLFRQ